jgi:hypothetical protein
VEARRDTIISSAGDPFVAAAPALADMTPSERDRILRDHAASEYRVALRKLAFLRVPGPDDDDE